MIPPTRTPFCVGCFKTESIPILPPPVAKLDHREFLIWANGVRQLAMNDTRKAGMMTTGKTTGKLPESYAPFCRSKKKI